MLPLSLPLRKQNINGEHCAGKHYSSLKNFRRIQKNFGKFDDEIEKIDNFRLATLNRQATMSFGHKVLDSISNRNGPRRRSYS